MQDIENSLNSAMSAMRRTAKTRKRKNDTVESVDSFSSVIEEIANERAEEVLYRERYRRRLEESADTVWDNTTDEVAEPTQEEDNAEAEPEEVIPPTEDSEGEAVEVIPPTEDSEGEVATDTEAIAEEIPPISDISEPIAEEPTVEPIVEEIVAEPEVEESAEEPTAEVTSEPTAEVTAEPTIEPTTEPTAEAVAPSPNQLIGYYIVPTVPYNYNAYSGYGVEYPQPEYTPVEEPTPEGVSTFSPVMPTDEPTYIPEYPADTEVDGYIPPDLSGGEGADFPIDTYEPDGEVNMPTGDGGYIGEIDYGDNPPDNINYGEPEIDALPPENINYGEPEIDALPPENINYGEPEIDALPPENINYGEPEIDALPPENINYGEPEIDALPPENIDYGPYTDPYSEGGEIDIPVDLGGYPDELSYPELTDISDGVHAVPEGSLYFLADRIDENVKLVEMRMLYEIADFKNKHKMSTLSFSLEFGREYRNERELYREVNSRVSKMRKVLRLERERNRRYYLVLADRCIGDTHKREKNRAKIESIIRRMDFLLSERDRVNNRLFELYTGDIGDDKKPLAEKIGKRATRVAKRVYLSMRKLAKRVRRMHAPDELREKIFDLMNEKINEYARRTQLEESLRRLKPRGEAKRKMKKEYRESCRRIKYIESDLKSFIKKAERYDMIYRENGKQIAWIIATLVSLSALAVLYFTFKDTIDAFLKGLFGGG